MEQPVVELVITDDLGETTTEYTQPELSERRAAELFADGYSVVVV